jgi:hypothetical protein
MTIGSQQEGRTSAPHTRYIWIVALTFFSISSVVLSVNFLVDPLWFYQGSRLTSYNHHYNERFSKVNVFLQNPAQYDCVILGTSTATLLDAKKIAGYKCINFSFSRGLLPEYIGFLRFIKRHTDNIKLVIIGLDGHHMVDEPDRRDEPMPGFIRDGGSVPTPFRTYVGLGPFIASVKTLLNYTDSGRYYDGDFAASLLLSVGPYRPKDEPFNDSFKRKFGHAIGFFDTKNLKFVEELKATVPGAKFIGYVPPITAHYIAFLKLDGKLDNYLEAIYSAAPLFESFYDFTMPSSITKNPDTTNDGMHYSREVNDAIAAKINGERTNFGIKLNTIRFADFRRLFIKETDTFMTEAEIRDTQHKGQHAARQLENGKAN